MAVPNSALSQIDYVEERIEKQLNDLVVCFLLYSPIIFTDES